MDTLKSIRPDERIVILEGSVDEKSKITYVSVELQNREGAILIFMNHSDDIVEMILNEVDPQESGYMFFASELRLDPLNNTAVPKHRLATPDEVEKLKFRRMDINKLPVLRMSDPVRRWHNFPKGYVVAVERRDGTYFRRVD